MMITIVIMMEEIVQRIRIVSEGEQKAVKKEEESIVYWTRESEQ